MSFKKISNTPKASSLEKGNVIVVDDRPCKIVFIGSGEKHNFLSFRATDIITGEDKSFSLQRSAKIFIPKLDTRKGDFIYFEGDNANVCFSFKSSSEYFPCSGYYDYEYSYEEIKVLNPRVIAWLQAEEKNDNKTKVTVLEWKDEEYVIFDPFQ